MYFKKLNKNIKSPTKAYKDDAGIDVYSPYYYSIEPGEIKQIKLCIAIKINSDEVAIMSERSGMAIKYGITSIGNIIDSGYRGEISIILLNTGQKVYDISKNDKIGQIIIAKLGHSSTIINEVEDLGTSDRGDKAHYSSGK